MTIVYIALIIVSIVSFLAFIAPRNYHVSRSIVIKKPKTEVYDYIKFLKNQDEWSPWNKKDPNLKKSFTGIDGTIGFVSAWEGNKEVGSGEQEITNFVENELMQSQLRFLKPWKSQSDAYIRLQELNDATKVTWGFSGDSKFPMNLFLLFMSMDKAVGKDFEEGLINLKAILEKEV